MKKFMTIAMIILAASMLVVSCDTNKKAELDHSVTVEASIGVAQSKRLTVSNEKNHIARYNVYLQPMWKNAAETVGNEDPIYYGHCESIPASTGNSNYKANGVTTPSDYAAKHVTQDANYDTDVKSFTYTTSSDAPAISLGYLSQGQWKITVVAENEAGSIMYDGFTTTFFVKSGTKNANIVLSENTLASETGSVYVEFKTTNLTTATDVTATINFSSKDADDKLTVTTASDANGQRTVSGKIDGVQAGMNTYTIKVYSDNGSNLVGAVVGTVYVATDDTTTASDAAGYMADLVNVTGQLLPSDFVIGGVQISINTLYGYTTASDTITLTDPTKTAVGHSRRATGPMVTGTDYTFTFNALSMTDATITLQWYVDGVEQSGKTGKSYTVSFATPGDHNVSYVATATTADEKTAKYGEMIFMQVLPKPEA